MAFSEVCRLSVQRCEVSHAYWSRAGTRLTPMGEAPVDFSDHFFTYDTFSPQLDVVKQIWCVSYSNGLEGRSQ